MSYATVSKITYVHSNIQNVRRLEDKQMCSFHKRQVVSFNATTLDRVRIKPGMYARFSEYDEHNRTVTLLINEEKPHDGNHWYKVCNPMVNNHNTYCYIRTTDLQYDMRVVLYGAFNFEVFGGRKIVIHF